MARLQKQLIAYDISCHKRRRRALRLLRPFSDVYQDSVFDCRLSALDARNLQQALAELVDADDALLCIYLTDSVQSWQLGSGMEPLTAGLFVVG